MQKHRHMEIAQDMLTSFNDDLNLLKKVITSGESWVYAYDIELFVQSFQCKRPEEPWPKRARQIPANVKVLLAVFFDCNFVEHHEFLPQGRTFNKEYYLMLSTDCA